MDSYLRRCLELAHLPGAAVEPNPRVGAVVVHEGKIIGEGWHRQYGGPHAEVNAVAAVQDREKLKQATLYVSLEPCNHHGKTPPCTGLILEHQIPKVVIGSLDPNPQMAGRSVELLRAQGVEVEVASEQSPFWELNRHFWCNQKSYRPYITLKWAESSDGYIAAFDDQGQPVRTAISPPFISKWIHHLRHEHQAIMVGKNTVSVDDPSLTTRKWPGRSPVKIVFDPELELPPTAKIFSGEKVIVINQRRNEVQANITYFTPVEEEAFEDMGMLLIEIYGRLKVGSILVEGGQNLLNQFIQQSVWDEAWKNVGQQPLHQGVKAPVLPEMDKVSSAPGNLWYKKNPALRFP